MPFGLTAPGETSGAAPMSFVAKVEALRELFGIPAEVPLPSSIAKMNELMGIPGEGPLPKQVDQLVALSGVVVKQVPELTVSSAPPIGVPVKQTPVRGGVVSTPQSADSSIWSSPWSMLNGMANGHSPAPSAPQLVMPTSWGLYAMPKTEQSKLETAESIASAQDWYRNPQPQLRGRH